MDRNAANHHRTILLLAVGIVAAACLLQVLPSQRVALIGLADYPLPHSCLSRSLLGWNCPACGLTRSFIHLFHGDLQAAWESHRLGWLFAAIVVGQIPYRTVALRHPSTISHRRTWTTAAIYATLTLLVLNWLVSLLVV
jgi:hypothetical protein